MKYYVDIDADEVADELWEMSYVHFVYSSKTPVSKTPKKPK